MSRGGRGGGGRGGRTNDILSGRGERDISNGVGGRDIPSSGDGHTLSNTGKEQDKFSGDDYDEHDKFNGGGRHGNHGGGPGVSGLKAYESVNPQKESLHLRVKFSERQRIGGSASHHQKGLPGSLHPPRLPCASSGAQQAALPAGCIR
eukprot:XP_027303623.1 uncharacterized protein LOC113841103 isoform X5 [Anas platyrhynchos]